MAILVSLMPFIDPEILATLAIPLPLSFVTQCLLHQFSTANRSLSLPCRDSPRNVFNDREERPVRVA